MDQRAVVAALPAAFLPSPQPTRPSSVSMRRIAASKVVQPAEIAPVLAGGLDGNADPPGFDSLDAHDASLAAREAPEQTGALAGLFAT